MSPLHSGQARRVAPTDNIMQGCCDHRAMPFPIAVDDFTLKTFDFGRLLCYKDNHHRARSHLGEGNPV